MINVSGSSVRWVLQERLFVPSLYPSEERFGTLLTNGTKASFDWFGVGTAKNQKQSRIRNNLGSLCIMYL